MWNSAGHAPSLRVFTLAFALQLRKKHGKNHSQGKRNLSQVNKNLSQSTVYILPRHPHITKPSWNMIRRSCLLYDSVFTTETCCSHLNFPPVNRGVHYWAYRGVHYWANRGVRYWANRVVHYCTNRGVHYWANRVVHYWAKIFHKIVRDSKLIRRCTMMIIAAICQRVTDRCQCSGVGGRGVWGRNWVSRNPQVAVPAETLGAHRFQYIEKVERGVCEWLLGLELCLYCVGVCKWGWYWIKA
jgi:hypothetical protein